MHVYYNEYTRIDTNKVSYQHLSQICLEPCRDSVELVIKIFPKIAVGFSFHLDTNDN